MALNRSAEVSKCIQELEEGEPHKFFRKFKDVSLEELRKRLEEFAKVGEVGEGKLSEIFQWKEEVERGLPNWSDDDKNISWCSFGPWAIGGAFM